MHPTNRGVALYEERVYLGTEDAFVVALNAATGESVWETPVESYEHGYYLTLAPLVAKGKVMVGVSGSAMGVRGFVTALDARRPMSGLPRRHDSHHGKEGGGRDERHRVDGLDLEEKSTKELGERERHDHTE